MIVELFYDALEPFFNFRISFKNNPKDRYVLSDNFKLNPLIQSTIPDLKDVEFLPTNYQVKVKGVLLEFTMPKKNVLIIKKDGKEEKSIRLDNLVNLKSDIRTIKIWEIEL